MSKNKLQGPRPLRKHLTSIDLDNPPRSAAEALSMGVNQYINREGDLTTLRQIDNPRRQSKIPLSHGNTEKYSSRKANRGAVERNQATITTSEQQFIDFGKRNGYTVQQSKDTYKRFVERNRAQVASVPKGMHNDHFLPHKSEYYQAGENHRTKLILSPKVNGYKTDKMPTPAELRGLGMPTSQTELIRQEFADLPAPDVKKARALASKIASDPSRERARDSNTRFKEAQQRRAALNGDLHLPIPGAFYGSESGSQIVDRANGNMRSNGYAALMGMPLDLF